MTVGTSTRTLGKHDLLHKLLGKQVGASSKLIAQCKMAKPFVMIDLCAGDGVDSLESGQCSPGIIYQHSEWLNNAVGDPNASIRIFIEKDKSTFDQLSNSVYSQNSHLILGDSSSPEVIGQVKHLLQGKISHSSPVFIQSDPNHAHDWQIKDFYLHLSFFVTTYSTIGCNVRGIKRRPMHVRLEWFEKLKSIINRVKQTNGRLTCCLVSLEKDSDQWGYLMTVPSKWGLHTVSSAKTAFKYWESGYRISFMDSPQGFNDHANFMFLTKKEYSDGTRIDLI